MAKYYRHKENPYVVGGVNWRKVIKLFGWGILAVIVLLIVALRVQAVIEYISDPRIRTEPEFYEHLTNVFEESEVQVIAEGSDCCWHLIMQVWRSIVTLSVMYMQLHMVWADCMV